MFKNILLSVAVLGAMGSQAVTLVCQEEKMPTYSYIVLGSTIENADKSTATVIAAPDKAPQGTVGTIYGVVSMKYDAKLELLNVHSTDAKDLWFDWNRIDPEKQCFRFITGNNYVLKKVGNVWNGEVAADLTLRVHPLKRNCRHPMPAPARPRKVTCKQDRLQVND